MKKPIKKYIIENALVAVAQLECKDVSEIYNIVERMTGEPRTAIRRVNSQFIVRMEKILMRLKNQ